MRKLPTDSVPPAVNPNMRSKKVKGVDVPFVTQERKYELITPLFGGGVEPNINDDLTPISGKAIRGHLRFWWRATRGGRFGGNLQKMKEAEAAIWGAASTVDNPNVSPVSISVVADISERRSNQIYKDKRLQPNWTDIGYAAFPLQEKGETVASRIKFTLFISYPASIPTFNNLRTEIEAALWAWETFGGIGARTRRGFGALKCTKGAEALPEKPEKIEKKIRGKLTELTKDGVWHDSVPHLSTETSFVIVSEKKRNQSTKTDNLVAFDGVDAVGAAWDKLISELKKFRQNRNDSKTKGAGRGRSKWNEPERIREITGQRLTGHGAIPALVAIEPFSRAQFGLPILFQFFRNDKNEYPPYKSSREPVDTTLKGGRLTGFPDKFRERLASRLILRPLSCGNDKAVGLAAILHAPRNVPEGLLLKGDCVDHVCDLTITKKDALNIDSLKSFASKLTNNSDEVDVLEAFIDRFKL